MGGRTTEFVTRRKLFENPGITKSGRQGSQSVKVEFQTNQLSTHVKLNKRVPRHFAAYLKLS